LRRRSILRLNRCANHQLALLADPPIEPLCQPLACASGRPSGCAFQSASGFRRLPTFQLRLPDGLRLSPIANLPALPTNPTSDSHRLVNSPASPSCQSWTRVFDQPSGYRTIKPSTFVWERPSGPAFEPNHRLAARSSVEVTVGLVCLCTQVQNYRILWIIYGRWRLAYKALHRQAERKEAAWLAKKWAKNKPADGKRSGDFPQMGRRIYCG
jgi:hypothetical protein